MKSAICLLSAVGAIALSASAAYAADLAPQPMYKAPPLPPPATYSWTGFYIGANGGFGGDRFEYPGMIGGIGGSARLDSSGFFGGGQLGFNWQFAPTWVLGVEGDFDAADIEGMASASTAFGGASAGSKVDWFGTVRGRAGYLVTPNALLYGTGGWAYGRTTSSASATLTGVASASTSISSNQNGWTAGGGLEYAFNPWLSFKTEYLFVDLGTASLVSGTVLGVPYSLSEKTTFHTVKAGINVKLGGWDTGWAR